MAGRVQPQALNDTYNIEINIDTNTEHTPLLSNSPLPENPTSRPQDVAIDSQDEAAIDLRAQLRAPVTFLAFAVLFLLEMGFGMIGAPTGAIMESILCRQLHPDELSPLPISNPNNGSSVTVGGGVIRFFAGDVFLVDDPICKSPDVQGQLAMLKAWGYTFDCLVGALLAVPYGMMSDKWGRKPVILMSLLGLILGQIFTDFVYFFSDLIPLWTVWFSAAFQIIGGGSTITVAMLYTVIADVVPVSERATVFLQLTACYLTSQMIAGPLGGVLMIRDPWIPLLLSLGVLFLTALVVWAFPETLRVHDSKTDRLEEEEGGEEQESLPRIRKLWDKACNGAKDLFEFILGNKSLVLLMLSLTFTLVGRFVGEVLLQYSTKRYGWSWSDASVVLTIRSAVSLLALLVLTPFASWFCLQRLRMGGMSKDLWLARWSGMIAIAGSLIIASAENGHLFSVGLVWLALGSGFTPLIRSLLNSLVEEHHIGTMNTLIGFMETVGLTIAGPLLGECLSVGFQLGGPWVGLPFFAAASFFTVACVILWIFRLPGRPESSAEPVC